MAKPEDATDQPDPAERLFQDTVKRFSIVSAIINGPLSGFLFGYHWQLPRDRVQRLQNSANAKALRTGLSELTDQQSAHFQGLASVNKEQADAAFRYTAIVNFTAPFTLVILVNQLYPSLFAIFLNLIFDREHAWLRLIVVIAAITFATLAPLIYAYVSAGVARDIHHLALLDGARRGNRSSAGADDGEDAALDPKDL